MTIPLLLAINGCSEKAQCPKPSYPELLAIDKVQRIKISWNNDGSLNTANAQLLGKQNKNLRINDNYYHTTLVKYNEDFITKK